MKKKNRVSLKKKYYYFGVVGLFILVALTIVAVNYIKEDSVTGSSVFVKYYGVSNYPLNKYSGKIQTYIKFTQPDLGNLKTAGGVIAAADSITKAADFANGVVGLYQGNPPFPIPTGALDVVISASSSATGFFKSDTKCLREIGSRYGSQKEIEIVLVSSLAYAQCTQYSDWNYAFVKHAYYTLDGKFICQQEGSKLFSVQQMTGKTSKSTFGC